MKIEKISKNCAKKEMPTCNSPTTNQTMFSYLYVVVHTVSTQVCEQVVTHCYNFMKLLHIHALVVNLAVTCYVAAISDLLGQHVTSC